MPSAVATPKISRGLTCRFPDPITALSGVNRAASSAHRHRGQPFRPESTAVRHNGTVAWPNPGSRAEAFAEAGYHLAVPVIPIHSEDDERVADYRNIPDPELVERRGIFVAEGRLVVRRLLE